MLISWNTTRACNLRCRHCYRDAGVKDKDELSTEEGKRLLQDIKESGFKIVVLSGGEPLMRADIYEIIQYASQIGLRPVLGSNGTLITEEVAARLKDAGIARVGISLDSIIPEVHDGFRGVKGAFEKVISAIAAMKRVGLEFQVHTTVTKYNYEQIDALIDYVVSLGASAYHIFFLVPSGRGENETESLISQEQYYCLIDHILKRQKELDFEIKPVCAPQFVPISFKKGMNLRFQRGCLAGISYCCVLPNGDVHPCPYLPIKLGNVRIQRFSVIWKENEILSRLRSLNYRGRCGECKDKDICGGCRARAYFSSGDYMGEDEYCSLFIPVLDKRDG